MMIQLIIFLTLITLLLSMWVREQVMYGRTFKLRQIPVRTLQSSEDISVELKVGVENIPADSNPIFVLTDEKDGHY